MLYVVGTGIARGQMTERGRKLIENADVVYGSRKALEIAGVDGVVIEKFCRETYSKIEREAKYKKVVVLSTGDPMVSGLGKKLKADYIEPGISSVLVALSKLKVDLCEVVVVNCHNKNCLKEILKALEFRPVIALVSKGFKLEISGVRITVLENLCSDRERIYEVAEKFEVRENETILFLRL